MYRADNWDPVLAATCSVVWPSTLIHSTTTTHSPLHTFLSYNLPHTVEEPPVLWVGLGLVVDELHLDSLHRTDNDNSLTHTRPQATQQGSPLGEVALRVCSFVLQKLKHRKSAAPRKGQSLAHVCTYIHPIPSRCRAHCNASHTVWIKC